MKSLKTVQAETEKIFSEKIKHAASVDILKQLEKKIELHYNNGTISENGLRKLDDKLVSRMVLFDTKPKKRVRKNPPLTAAKRKRLKSSDFVFPKKRAYPIDTKARARSALARIDEYGTQAERRKVRAAVHRRYPGMRVVRHNPPTKHAVEFISDKGKKYVRTLDRKGRKITVGFTDRKNEAGSVSTFAGAERIAGVLNRRLNNTTGRVRGVFVATDLT